MYYVCPQIELISIKPSEMYQFFIGYPPYRALPYESLFFLSFWPHGRHLLAACTQNQWRERKKETLQTHVLIRFSSGFYIVYILISQEREGEENLFRIEQGRENRKCRRRIRRERSSSYFGSQHPYPPLKQAHMQKCTSEMFVS